MEKSNETETNTLKMPTDEEWKAIFDIKPKTTNPRYIQDDVKVVRVYIAGGSVWGRPHAEESFQRIIEALEQWGGGKLDD